MWSELNCPRYEMAARHFKLGISWLSWCVNMATRPHSSWHKTKHTTTWQWHNAGGQLWVCSPSVALCHTGIHVWHSVTPSDTMWHSVIFAYTCDRVTPWGEFVIGRENIVMLYQGRVCRRELQLPWVVSPGTSGSTTCRISLTRHNTTRMASRPTHRV